MYATILVPYDGSPMAERAGTHAIELADRFDAVVHGVFVDESTDSQEATIDQDDSGEAVLNVLEKHARRRSIDVETNVVEGEPGTKIVDMVSEIDADIVVMGTHGRSGLDRLLVGSVAEQVIRTSPVPVTTLGPSNEVTSAQEAKRMAGEELESLGIDADVEAPSQQQATWIVPATNESAEYNVHIETATGTAKVVELG
jgi:nucleotide-binding universal stress UspA family protein